MLTRGDALMIIVVLSYDCAYQLLVIFGLSCAWDCLDFDL